MTAIAATLVVLSVISAGYWAWASYSVARFVRRRRQPVSRTSPVSVLKPLRGDHPLLYESLRSFCEQDHPSFEIVFGVSDPLDPAAAVVRRLIDNARFVSQLAGRRVAIRLWTGSTCYSPARIREFQRSAEKFQRSSIRAMSGSFRL